MDWKKMLTPILAALLGAATLWLCQRYGICIG